MRTCALWCMSFAVTACGGTTQGVAATGDSDAFPADAPLEDGSGLDDSVVGDSGPATREAGAQDSATACGGNISFDLAVDTTGPVYYEIDAGAGDDLERRRLLRRTKSISVLGALKDWL